MGLSPCCGSLCKLPCSHKTQSFVNYLCAHYDWNCLGAGHGGDNQQQHILIIVSYPQNHINSIDPSIMFTIKGNQENGAIHFLDTLVKPEADHSLSIRVYHKSTHTDQYLQWDSHHSLSAKYSVIGTLTHRAKSVCTTPGLLEEELQCLKETLVRCKYPRWAINKVQNKVINGKWEESGTTHVSNTMQDSNGLSNNSQTTFTPGGRPSMGHIVIQYVQGLGESIKCTCFKYGIRTHFKGNRTLKQILVKPKDKDPQDKKSCVIYCYQCSAIDCGEGYIGEIARTLGERYQEHLRGPSSIQVHNQLMGHQTTKDNFSIIGREGQDFTRLIKESIVIRVNNPTLNRNIGKCQLSHIWDRVLFSTPGIKVAIPQGNAQHSP